MRLMLSRRKSLPNLKTALWEVQGCWAKMFVVGSVAQMFEGGLGRTIMRLIYVRCGNFVQRQGYNKIAGLILGISQSYTWILVFMYCISIVCVTSSFLQGNR